MPVRKARTAAYYETAPDSKLRPGDIWSDLPTFGLLPDSATRGVVITAACDLANAKTETVTYLPIVPLLRYFCLPAAVPSLLKRCQTHLRAAGCPNDNIPLGRGFIPPRAAELEAAKQWLNQNLNDDSPKPKRDAARRASAGLAVLLRTWRTEASSTDGLYEDLELVWGVKDFRDICEKLVTNDIPVLHFLPADNQSPEYSGVPEHSLVLFRYPITVPAEYLYSANDVGYPGWRQGIQELDPLFPRLSEAFITRPLKRTALRKEFSVDLLTRYVSLYNRIGSPSLAAVSVSRILGQLKDTRQ